MKTSIFLHTLLVLGLLDNSKFTSVLAASSSSSTPPGLFTSDGQILNVDYANNAVSNRPTTLVAFSNQNYAVIMSHSKKQSLKDLVESKHHSIIKAGRSKIPRHKRLTKHIGLAYIGIVSDGIHLTEKMFDESLQHLYAFGSEPVIPRFVSNIADYIHMNTLYPDRSRPFGINMCVIGCDDTHGPQVHQVDCFGNVFHRHMTCTGKKE